MMIITIDGTAGTGKTTVAKKVADLLHLPFFDTGAMYRAVTWMMLDKGIHSSDEVAVKKLLEEFSFRIHGEGNEKRYFVGSHDVTEEIRTQKITALVSEVSAMQAVRSALWQIQRSFAAAGGGVFEGRDMGSVVFPNADIKVFLTARPEVRAERRLAEMIQKNPKDAALMDHEKMVADLIRRDTLDSSRTIAPLKCPDGAYQIDTSDLTIDQVVSLIVKHAKEETSNG